MRIKNYDILCHGQTNVLIALDGVVTLPGHSARIQSNKSVPQNIING